MGSGGERGCRPPYLRWGSGGFLRNIKGWLSRGWIGGEWDFRAPYLLWGCGSRGNNFEGCVGKMVDFTTKGCNGTLGCFRPPHFKAGPANRDGTIGKIRGWTGPLPYAERSDRRNIVFEPESTVPYPSCIKMSSVKNIGCFILQKKAMIGLVVTTKVNHKLKISMTHSTVTDFPEKIATLN